MTLQEMLGRTNAPALLCPVDRVRCKTKGRFGSEANLDENKDFAIPSYDIDFADPATVVSPDQAKT